MGLPAPGRIYFSRHPFGLTQKDQKVKAAEFFRQIKALFAKKINACLVKDLAVNTIRLNGSEKAVKLLGNPGCDFFCSLRFALIYYRKISKAGGVP